MDRVRIPLAVLALLLGLSLTSALGAPSATASTATQSAARATAVAATTTTIAGMERRVVELTNVRRRARGCAALRVHSALDRSAHRHTVLMARAGVLSHRLPGERDLGPRISAAGYRGWTRLAENVAYGYRSPYAVVRAWMASSSHRRNMLDCRLRHIGVGVVSRDGVLWWTQNFGRR